MLEYEKITKDNVEEIFSNLFKEFQTASYNDREKISKIVDKYILDFSKVDLLPNEKIAIEENKSINIFEKSSDVEIWNLIEIFKDKERVFDKYPGIIFTNNDIKFSYFKYIDNLDIILARKYNLYINNDKLYISPSNAAYIITRKRIFYALNACSPWAAIVKNCNSTEVPNLGINGKKPCNMAKVFESMFGQSIFWNGANKFLAIENIASLNNLEKSKIKVEVKTGPKQVKIDELVKIPLPKIDVEVPKDAFLAADTPYTKTFIQSYGKNKAVIRWLLKNKITDCVLEGFRIYVDGKTLYPCKNNNDGKFVYIPISNFKLDNFISCEMADFKEKDCEGTILSYYSSVVKSIPTELRSLIIFEFIREPKVEQLYKMGLEKYFQNLLNDGLYDLISNFEKDFIITNTQKEKNIYKYIGLNKYQFNILLKDLNVSEEKALYKIKIAKTIFTKFSDVDNKTTDAFFEICDKIYTPVKKGVIYKYGYDYKFENEILRTLERYEDDIIYFRDNSDENIRKNFITSIFKALTLSSRSRQYFFDFIRMAHNIDDVKTSILFDDANDLKNKHDNLSVYISLIKDRYTFKQFINSLKKVKDLEFNDDNYCVVIPKGPNDLIEEGNALHHCVGGYVRSVAEGQTNIVFIRKKDEIDTPFFTVEVSNKGNIEQVHGFGNSNADSISNLPAFIKKWAAEKKLKLTDANKVR